MLGVCFPIQSKIYTKDEILQFSNDKNLNLEFFYQHSLLTSMGDKFTRESLRETVAKLLHEALLEHAGEKYRLGNEGKICDYIREQLNFVFGDYWGCTMGVRGSFFTSYTFVSDGALRIDLPDAFSVEIFKEPVRKLIF